MLRINAQSATAECWNYIFINFSLNNDLLAIKEWGTSDCDLAVTQLNRDHYTCIFFRCIIAYVTKISNAHAQLSEHESQSAYVTLINYRENKILKENLLVRYRIGVTACTHGRRHENESTIR